MTDWIQTYTGKAFPILAPKPSDVDIEDIAHALSNLCRFAGHTREFYSVAQHSVLVSRIVPIGMARQALLHDAPEAYIVDIPRPLKYSGMINGYRTIEDKIWSAICEKFGIYPAMYAEVKEADDIVLFTEKRDLLGPQPLPCGYTREPMKQTIKPWAPEFAKGVFLDRFKCLWDNSSTA